MSRFPFLLSQTQPNEGKLSWKLVNNNEGIDFHFLILKFIREQKYKNEKGGKINLQFQKCRDVAIRWRN